VRNDDFACRACGLLQAEAPWGDDGQSPVFEICDCCGAEFGYEDATLEAVTRARRLWLEKGAPWSNPKAMSSTWSVKAQLAQVPPVFQGG
jgi:hypothetical protein